MAANPYPTGRIAREILLHLLENHAQQTQFEASERTTEAGISKRFNAEDPEIVKKGLRELEVSRLIYGRTQYVVGHTEAKHVFSLTLTGHRVAQECQKGAPLKLGTEQSESKSASSRDDYPDDDDDGSRYSDDLPDDPGDDLEFSHGGD